MSAGLETATALDARRPYRRWGAWYVAEHRIRGFKAYFATLLATAIGTPFLYLYCFGIGLSTLIGGRGSGLVDGVPYLQFFAPAMLCAFVIAAASEEAMFGTLMGFKWNRTFVAMHAAPITPHQIVDGSIIMISVRVLGSAILYGAVAAAFGAFVSPAAVLVVPIALLTALAFTLPVMAYASSLEEDRGQFAIINRLVVIPLSLFSGTMFPLEVLPIWLQWIGWLSPLWHGAELSRIAAYGMQEAGWLTVVHLVVLLAFAVTGWLVTRRITRRRLEK